jgi:BNR/Asp-box repeat
MDDDPALGRRRQRAIPLIGAALTVIVVAGFLYLRATAPQPSPILGASPVPQIGSQYRVDYNFTSAKTGWAAVAQYTELLPRFWIYRTTDGARTWQEQFHGSTIQGAPLSLQFFDANHGILVVDRVYRTDDGGGHWSVISLPDGTPVFGFASGRRGWAVDGAQLYVTDDGGLTWQAKSQVPGSHFAAGNAGPGSIQFSAGGEGWEGTTADQPTVYVSNDNGTTWRPVALPPFPSLATAGKPLFFETSIQLIPDGGVIAVAHDDFGRDMNFSSHDHGRTWQAIELPSASIRFFTFVGARHWFASFQNVLYETRDGGLTWDSVRMSVSLGIIDWTLGSARMIDATHGWAVITSPASRDASSGLVMTSDGGMNWTTVSVPRPG